MYAGPHIGSVPVLGPSSSNTQVGAAIEVDVLMCDSGRREVVLRADARYSCKPCPRCLFP